MEKMEQVVPPARIKDIVTRDMPDEVLVYDLKNHKAHCLNQTAATVWKYCDGQATVTEIVKQLKNDLNLTIDEATVWLAVERLSRANLLESQIAAPAGSSRQSRRETMRRLGFGVAVSVPLVMSIVAPTAMAGASVCFAATDRPIGCNCATSSECQSNCCDVAAPGPSGLANTCRPVSPTNQRPGGSVTCNPAAAPAANTTGPNNNCCSGSCRQGPVASGGQVCV